VAVSLHRKHITYFGELFRELWGILNESVLEAAFHHLMNRLECLASPFCRRTGQRVSSISDIERDHFVGASGAIPKYYMSSFIHAVFHAVSSSKDEFRRVREFPDFRSLDIGCPCCFPFLMR